MYTVGENPTVHEDGRAVKDASVGTFGGAIVKVTFAELLLQVAVIVTEAAAPRLNVVTVNVWLVCPFATVMLEGTVAAAVLLLDKVTLVPLPDAAMLSVTVPLAVDPAVITVGLTASVAMNGPDFDDGCVTVSAAVFVVAECVAEMLMAGYVQPAQRFVVIVKVAVRDPAATRTYGGSDVIVALSV
jgi:hypothetical protein